MIARKTSKRRGKRYRRLRTRKTSKSRQTKTKKAKKTGLLQTPRGTKDILPAEQKYWDFLREVVEETARAYNLKRMDTPILEDVNLFVRGVGEGTDIVEKEMFVFRDKGGNQLVLRPEGTAPVARSYIQNGMHTWSQPVRLFYFGPFFRHNRPQAGRYRQFHQFGVEILGDENPVLDAQVIQIAWRFFSVLGLEDLVIQVNSIGCAECRKDYIKVLKDYYATNRTRLCRVCKRRLKTNPLRILDCKEDKCQMLANNAPESLDHLCEECSGHFKEVLEYLEELNIPYNLNSQLVRGLDYYTKTVFEVWSGSEADASQSSLGGGGRYDDLIKKLGGGDVPAVGFALGLERIILKMQEQGIEIETNDQIEIFLAHLGEKAEKKALSLFEELSAEGFRVGEAFCKSGIKAQLRQADKLGVNWVLILGQKEVIDNTIILRNMESGTQEIVDIKKVAPLLKRRLKRE